MASGASTARRGRRRAGARGQALTEYVVLTFFGVAVLFVPFFPSMQGGGTVSIFTLMVQAFDVYINSFHTVITLPIP